MGPEFSVGLDSTSFLTKGLSEAGVSIAGDPGIVSSFVGKGSNLLRKRTDAV